MASIGVLAFVAFAAALFIVSLIYVCYTCARNKMKDDEQGMELSAIKGQSQSLLDHDHQQPMALRAENEVPEPPSVEEPSSSGVNLTTRTTFEDKIVCITGQSKSDVDGVKAALQNCAPGAILRDITMTDAELNTPQTKFETVEMKSLSMVVVAFSCKGVRLPLVGDGGKLEPLINMLISRGECAGELQSVMIA